MIVLGYPFQIWRTSHFQLLANLALGCSSRPESSVAQSRGQLPLTPPQRHRNKTPKGGRKSMGDITKTKERANDAMMRGCGQGKNWKDGREG